MLFTAVPMVGHFHPLVGLAWALRCGGDEVLVATPVPGFGSVITGAGLPAAVVPSDIGDGEYAAASGVDFAAGSVDAALAASGRGWGMLAGRALAGMRGLVGAFRPDVVVSEPCEFAGRIAAAEAGVPWIEHAWGLPPLEQHAAGGSEVLGRLPRPIASVHPSPPSLWPSGTTGMAMRPTGYHGPARRWEPREPAAAPRVLVTFGSVVVEHGRAGDLVEIVRRLAAGGLEVIVGLADALVPRLGTLPDGVVHAGWTPLHPTLDSCDLVVHHGGTGTAMAAVAAGVPQVMLPQMTDHFPTAERVAASGCGAVLASCPAPAEVERAALRVLDEPSCARAATRLAQEVRELPSTAAVAERVRAEATETEVRAAETTLREHGDHAAQGPGQLPDRAAAAAR
ncbi:nucleotide disphospho-sugar-binding domain-containing protein [Actinomadura montaniterrae]|uniref:nucleotide disphospho-sugar-binding domain-containing protein n=1 Tax=Actinomadura montaniterrae TaxID=1803903 RepID=UPI00384FE96E